MAEKQRISDAELSELKISNTVVREIIGAKLGIDALKADFSDGTLTLRGRAADARTREQALAIATRTPGVRRVEDRLEVATGSVGSTPAAPGAPGAPAGARTYTVKKGDTLSAIAQRELGAASRWKELFEANRGTVDDADKIFPGQVLKIPK